MKTEPSDAAGKIVRRGIPINSANDLRRYLGRILKEHREGLLTDGQAKAQGYIAGMILKCLDAQVEERLSELEATMAALVEGRDKFR